MIRRLVTLSAAVLAAAVATSALASDKLVVLSPHRKTIQEEMIPLFEKYYAKTFGTPIEVEWVDQGGTSNAVKYLKSKAESNPKTVGFDVFWGGTAANFVDMANAGLLEPYELPAAVRAEIPKTCSGVALSDAQDRWHATVVSSFGIVYNKAVLKLEGLPEPKVWADLGDARWSDQISLTDPRKSGTNSTMNMIVVDAEGWDKGWRTLARVAANTRRFTESSSDPVRAVSVGDAAAAMAIDFYALAQVWELGADKIGFVLPKGQTVLDPDPIAVVKGGGNKQAAHRFVDYLMTLDSQKVWVLPKGTPGGPVRAHLSRLAVNPKAYAATEGQRLGLMNPFEQTGFMTTDLEKAGRLRDPFNDLYGTVLVDTHADLKKAWQRVLKDGAKAETLDALLAPFVSEKEMLELSAKWQDDVVRNTTINRWASAARTRYKAIAEGQTPPAAKTH